MNLYNRYWVSDRKCVIRPHLFVATRSSVVPGFIGDPANKKPGGFRRFERWVDRPYKAQLLYWRRKGRDEAIKRGLQTNQPAAQSAAPTNLFTTR